MTELFGLAGAGGPGLSQLLAKPGWDLVSLSPTWAFPRATHSTPGLPGSNLNQMPEKIQLTWGRSMGWELGGPGWVLALTLIHGATLIHSMPSLGLGLFFCPLLLNFLLWKNISLSESRENCRMNNHVHISELQLLSTHGQSCFISAPYPHHIIIQTNSQASFHHKYIKLYL